MKKPGSNILTLLIVIIVITSASCFAEDYWQQCVHYKIHATLDTLTHSIAGIQNLIYQNNSPDTLSELYFHLYPNAYQPGSIMEQEVAAASFTLIRSNDDLGWMKIDSLLILKRASISRRVNIVTLVDDTILKIALDPPLLPTEELSVWLNFRTKIPKANPLIDKGGYRGNHYEISQWYPKMCVYDQNGWNAMPYHWLGEYYGEFGAFDVTLDVPGSYIVGATGEVVAGDPGWDLVKVDSSQSFHSLQAGAMMDSVRRIVTFHAEHVHDFMWIVSPNFVYQTGFFKNIPIHILHLRSSFEKWRNTALTDARRTLDFLETLVGDYPYPVLSICQGIVNGGMEYPTMAILGEFDPILLQHEIAHAYFYAALANNEQAEGWLDEGITTYQNELFINQYFPNYNNQPMEPSLSLRQLTRQFKPIRLKDLQLNSLYYYFYSGFDQPLNRPGYATNNAYRYAYHVYQKPAKFFAMLNYLVGHDAFIRILRTYYAQCKFTHVTGKKFQQICEQVTEINLDWFFTQWLESTTRLDYAYRGKKSEQQNNGTWKTDVIVKRLGNGIIPVDIEARTCAGDSARIRWDGKAKRDVITFQTWSKVTSVRLDPDDHILDQNRFNNAAPRVKLFYYPEFPSMYYLPRDAYSLFLWPQAWYNDVDGFTLGMNVLGGYLNRYSVIRNSIVLGVRSQRLHYKFGFSHPWERIDHNLWRHVSFLNIEGRRELDANLSYHLYRAFGSQATDAFRLGFVHQKLVDEKYGARKMNDGKQTITIRDWDAGDVNTFYFSYSTSTKRWLPWLASLDFSSELSHNAWRSDFDFIRLALKYQLQFGVRAKSWRINFRNFIGYIHHGNSSVPLQSQFWLAEGNPNQRFKYYYLRSPGSVPAWLPYHLPGDGNLRGYANQMNFAKLPLTANRLVTANVEFIHRNAHHLLPKFISHQFSGITCYVFFDGGAGWDTRLAKHALFDAGIGFRFYREILGKQRQLRVDFPLWLSHPNIAGASPKASAFQFRWIVSFQ